MAGTSRLRSRVKSRVRFPPLLCAFCRRPIAWRDVCAAIAPVKTRRGTGTYTIAEVHNACHHAWLLVHQWTEEAR